MKLDRKEFAEQQYLRSICDVLLTGDEWEVIIPDPGWSCLKDTSPLKPGIFIIQREKDDGRRASQGICQRSGN